MIFVLKRTEKIGLLFEGTKLNAGDLLDAEALEQGTISIYQEAGGTVVPYTTELPKLFAEHFSALKADDFVLHQGVNACLFVCPPLGMYTHGYDAEAVEPVVRFYISKLFELWDNGAKCTPEQEAFFQKHKDAWNDHGSGFIKFAVITATGN